MLVELAADMEDYYQHCVDRGMSPGMARGQVEKRLEPSAETLAELHNVHSTGLASWLRGPRGSAEFVLVMLALGTRRGWRRSGPNSLPEAWRSRS